MLHKLFLMPFALLVIALTSPASAAAPNPCKGYTPEFEVFTVFPHVNEDHSLRSVELSSTDAWGALMVDHLDGVNRFTAQPDFKVVTKNGVECHIMTKVVVIYRMDNTLRINNQFPVGSCEYKQTLLHAQRHIEVAKNFQQQSAPVVGEFLMKSMDGQGGMQAGKYRENETNGILQKKLTDLLAGYAKYLNDEHRKLESKILDNPEEMKKMFSACPGWQMPEVTH